MNHCKIYDNSLTLPYSQNDNHPLIPNQNTYYKQDKLITINSGDRNIIKYPESSSFEILLPTDIVNVATVQLKNWMFPVEFNTFSYTKNNLQMEFTLFPITYSQTSEYDPGANITGSTANQVEYDYINIVNEMLDGGAKFIININHGVYTNVGLANEIQNKMNVIVDNFIIQYIQENGGVYYPYTYFKVITCEVENKFWFVNTLNAFAFNNDSMLYKVNNLTGDIFNPCSNEKLYPSFSYFGLPAYLGFKNIYQNSVICSDKYDLTIMDASYSSLPEPSFLQNYVVILGITYYINVFFIKPFYKYTLLKDTYILLDIETLNGADETKPFTDNEYTKTTNQGNGSVNAFLGRIPLVSSTNSLSYATSNGGGDYQQMSNFNPPLERLRKFKISLRYHDGSLVDFGLNEWSFSLNVVSYIPSQNVKITKTPF